MIDGLPERVRGRVEHLLDSRRLRLPIAITQRFFRADGLDLGGLLALELFTVVIPLLLLGFSYASSFSTEVSFGDALIRQLNLDGDAAELVRSAFGDGASLRGTWTVVGLASFLVWGIPMASQVARVFAAAWQRDRFPFAKEVRRGTVWFVLYLTTLAIMDSRYVAQLDGAAARPGWLALLAGLIPSFLLWSATPFILVPGVNAGWSHIFKCGLVGVVISSVTRLAMRVVLPGLISGWVGFGPIGVAMALMTWSGVVAVSWVVIACASAVVWERSVPVGVATSAVEARTS